MLTPKDFRCIAVMLTLLYILSQVCGLPLLDGLLYGIPGLLAAISGQPGQAGQTREAPPHTTVPVRPEILNIRVELPTSIPVISVKFRLRYYGIG